jgi:hypothetical protein
LPGVDGASRLQFLEESETSETETTAIIGAITGTLALILGCINTYKEFFQKPRLSVDIRDRKADILNNSGKTVTLYRVYTETIIEFPLPIGERRISTSSPKGETTERSEPIYETAFELDFLKQVKHLEPHKGLVIELQKAQRDQRIKSMIQDLFISTKSLLQESANRKRYSERHPSLITANTRMVVEYSEGIEANDVEYAFWPTWFNEDSS